MRVALHADGSSRQEAPRRLVLHPWRRPGYVGADSWTTARFLKLLERAGRDDSEPGLKPGGVHFLEALGATRREMIVAQALVDDLERLVGYPASWTSQTWRHKFNVLDHLLLGLGPL